ncbi:alpha-helical ferredoxin domain-containing protein [Desulfonema limicola]|uniref:Alpha-helical ferredoxin domain-containing protein n=1 Tax=Desulfonema limicola TaxID=45656 RepID=A0A975BCE7_9BACT|nr:4Fe-4S dicluster domain-containing protein [Desulfonema limicola]QTA82787.1 alpha-helical ferredoxin domain-containing protein [Desulfonema limicola]
MKAVQSVDSKSIRKMLDQNKNTEFFLSVCVSCGMCADSCFLYVNNNKDPSYMPSYKAVHSLGRLYRKKGKVSLKELEDMKDLIWNKCVLCTRCYCPVGISIPSMIAQARSICRSQGICREYDQVEQPKQL